MEVTRLYGREWRGCLAVLCLAALLWTSPTSAQEAPWPAGCATSALPAEPEGRQEILTCVPEAWNGLLVLYVHGYVPPHEPLQLPLAGDAAWRRVPEELMQLGFAFATTSLSRNGIAIEQAGRDINALVDHFAAAVAPRPPEQILLFGGSQGALIATMLLERQPGRYHGAVAACGPLAGAPAAIDYVGDFRVLFDYFFPQVFDFGLFDGPPAMADWEAYRMLVREALAQRPEAAAELAAVSGVPGDAAQFADAAVTLLGYAVGGFEDLLAIAGGNPYDNAQRQYQGSSDDAALNQGVQRVSAEPEARAYLERFYRPTGELQRPLAVLHTSEDPIVLFQHATTYADRVADAGSQSELAVFPVERFGHCNLESSEVLGALGWLLDRMDVSTADLLGDYLEAELEQRL